MLRKTRCEPASSHVTAARVTERARQQQARSPPPPPPRAVLSHIYTPYRRLINKLQILGRYTSRKDNYSLFYFIRTRKILKIGFQDFHLS